MPGREDIPATAAIAADCTPRNGRSPDSMAVNFDLHDLIAFRAAAELSNFRKAAEAVHISQPAFSRRIDKLEQALGVRLFERTIRRVTQTAAGRGGSLHAASACCRTAWMRRC